MDCNCGGTCGACCGSMSTSNPNPSICQAPSNNCGAGNLSATLNAIGKWGSVLTAQAQGRAVVVGKSNVAIGAKGATTLPGNLSSTSILLIVIVLAAIAFVATRG